MICIRYRDLSGGLHAVAECSGRGTTLFLVPGLTAGQRRAALRRLRHESRRGCGPRLPAAQLGVAVAADQVRSAVGQLAAAVRLHPALIMLPTVLVAVLAWLFVATTPLSQRGIAGQQGPGVLAPGITAQVTGGQAGAGLPPGR